MNKVTEFTPELLEALRKHLEISLKEACEKFGIHSLTLGRMMYQGSEFNVKMTGKVDPSLNESVKIKNLSYSKMLGYSDNIVGQIFEQQGKSFLITEIVLNRPKYPISATCQQDSKNYKFSAKAPFQLLDNSITYNSEKNMLAKMA